jgi:predicted dehydrogenase
MKKIYYLLVLSFLIFTIPCVAQSNPQNPVRMAMVGLSHGHSPWIFERKDKSDVTLVGIYEPDANLATSYAVRYNLDQDLFYTDLDKLLDQTKPEAILAFGSIYDHLAAVQAAAPRGIHVMMEKPLSAWKSHADQMKTLAEKHQILLLTNFETSWYPSTEKTYQLIQDSVKFGKIHKTVFHHGHKGPKEIGVGKEFLDWLADPNLNGGGAIIDFGCYGANIMTYLMKGQKPKSVTAITQTFKPNIYPNVDDEATIILDYGDAQAIIQASWNWPFDRKDMEVYGEKGYVITENKTSMRIKTWEQSQESSFQAEAVELQVYTDPFSYLADVIRGKIKVDEYSLYSLSNNMIVAEILDAARSSAATRKTVFLLP